MKAYIIVMMILNLLGAGIALSGAAQGEDLGTNALTSITCLGLAVWGISLLGGL